MIFACNATHIVCTMHNATTNARAMHASCTYYAGFACSAAATLSSSAGSLGIRAFRAASICSALLPRVAQMRKAKPNFSAYSR